MYTQISIVYSHCVNLNDYLQLELVCPNFIWRVWDAAISCSSVRGVGYVFCCWSVLQPADFYYVCQEPLYMLSWHKWYRIVWLAVLCTLRKLAWARTCGYISVVLVLDIALVVVVFR
jgi:hypothetical protein